MRHHCLCSIRMLLVVGSRTRLGVYHLRAMLGFDDHNTSGYHRDRRKQAVITAFVENPASRVLLRVYV